MQPEPISNPNNTDTHMKSWGSQDDDSQTEDPHAMENSLINDTTLLKKCSTNKTGPSKLQKIFTGVFPTPPIRINQNLRVFQNNHNKATETRAYNIKMNIDLRKYKTRAINSGEKIKSTIATLKRADPNLLILHSPCPPWTQYYTDFPM